VYIYIYIIYMFIYYVVLYIYDVKKYLYIYIMLLIFIYLFIICDLAWMYRILGLSSILFVTIAVLRNIYPPAFLDGSTSVAAIFVADLMRVGNCNRPGMLHKDVLIQ
jgi:hypothetical protein